MINRINLTNGQEDPRRKSKEAYDVLQTPKTSNFVWSKGRTLENISRAIYGDEKYWEVLADYNGIVNPLHVPEKVYILSTVQISKIYHE